LGASRAGLRVRKELVLGGDRRSPTLTLAVAVTNRSDAPIEATLGLEWTLMLLGGGGNPAAWWEVDGRRTAHDSAGTAPALTGLAQGNDYVGISVATTVSEPAEAWWAPVETVSISESGFERVYQGAGLLLSWPVTLEPGATRTVSVSHAVTTAHDRTAEALAALPGAVPGPAASTDS
jgi:alpha-amylase